MPGSIPVSATTRPAVSATGEPAGRRGVGVFTTPAGAVGLCASLAFFCVGVFAPALAPSDPFASVGPSLAAPSSNHVFGTDDLGRDLLSGIVHGARTSLLIMLTTTVLASAIGLIIGVLSGYHVGRLDDALMRVTEFVQVMPRFFLAVVVIALFGPGLDRLILVLGLTSWPATARVIRAQALSLRRQAFVEAAGALGASVSRVLFRHVLPNALPATIVVISVNAASVILLEAGLGFIGLGDPRVVSWGYLANNAQRFLRVAWWMAAFPGAAIALAILGLNLLGDALNDFLTPRSRAGVAGSF